MRAVFNPEILKKRLFLRIMEDIDAPHLISTSVLADCLETVAHYGMHKGMNKQDSADTQNIVKLVYLELLENRAHLLGDKEVHYFEKMFDKLND